MKPLAGVRVLDFTRFLPGPFCSMLLADFGADVVKVEAPDQPDLLRAIPPMAGPGGAIFCAINRGKRSICIDLKNPTGLEVALRLASKADVVMEGFRPGVLDRLGLSYDTVARTNPRLVWCGVTGYGQDGPSRDRPGHDINYMAASGALSLTRGGDGAPVLPGIQVADMAGAMSAALGVLMALVARERTGRGQRVDVSMTDAAFGLIAPHLAQSAADGWLGLLTGALPGYNVYPTSDGRYLAIGALEPKFWAALCAVIGRPDLIQRAMPAEDERDEAIAEVRETIRKRTAAEWMAEPGAASACMTLVADPADAIADPHLRARGMVLDAGPDGPSRGVTGVQVRLSDTPGEPGGPAPAEGGDTDAVLAEAGYCMEEVAGFRAGGAVR